eukprot:1502606-Amphidinium_carterae.1
MGDTRPEDAPLNKSLAELPALALSRNWNSHGCSDLAWSLQLGIHLEQIFGATFMCKQDNVMQSHMAFQWTTCGSQPANEEKTFHDNPSCVDMHEALEAPT